MGEQARMSAKFDIDVNGECVASGSVPDDGVNITGLEVGGTPLWGCGWGLQLKPGDILSIRVVDEENHRPILGPPRPRLTLVPSEGE